jgi:phage recombination protein Bet
MSQAMTTQQGRQQLVSTLGNSLYVGAKEESIEMAISYCESAGLDIMQKPVHIVPMNTKDPVSGQYEWRDVIMPGVGLYRIQADRSGTMAGISEPEFGPDATTVFRDKNNKQVEVTFPEWCKVTVSKLVGEHIVQFVAKEYWIENYATDSRKSDAPNAMWRRRVRGQIVKCAESQALRKGWPEVGQAPTAEEMEGKVLDGEFSTVSQPEAITHSEPAALPLYPDDRWDQNIDTYADLVGQGKKTPGQIIASLETKYTLSSSQVDQLNVLEKAA